ncbi:aromatic-L-amino-acid decarboxylase-like isoform X1 [Frankliniella occidentalis]|uniref:Aromatic-L-amino-acid decarboxylase-like isoform X1 n=2 Tax=Frankliniella occidentalis TaxID=133901 RepID=A0A6J1SLV0_FRAOC|nr:aromatic-L-amino-acid decarboxylase-like isoform X1 [Frankliniella occidentalis]
MREGDIVDRDEVDDMATTGDMSPDEFREFGKAAVDFIADYIGNIRDRPVLPAVEPGYLAPLLPAECPQDPEPWQEVMKDLEAHIMPGVTHWHSPSFHAYFPTANSFPGIVGEMLSAGLGVIGFSWITSPACTELEVIVVDWLGKLLGLPEEFLHSGPGSGGGVIQGSASEATLVAMLAARDRMVRRVRQDHPKLSDGEIRAKLVAYTSDQANSSVWKSGLLGAMPMRQLPTDADGAFRGDVLEAAIRSDRQKGLIPCYVVATLGTTVTCAFDNLEELGPVCNREGLWLHIDAAYAGAAYVCPEMRHTMAGVQYADSFDMNPHKWLHVNFDCSTMWVKNANDLENAFNVDPVYLKHDKQGVMPDYRHWQLPLGRRFRALKLWMVLRTYGARGLQAHIRKQVQLAADFEELVHRDARFEVVMPARCGLVCFRMVGPCARTQELLRRVTARKTLYMIAASVRGQAVLRFVVCSRLTELEDVQRSWAEIAAQAEAVLQAESVAAALAPAPALCDPSRPMGKSPSVVHNMLGSAGNTADPQHTV